jgi:hypothetical protein
MANSWNLIIRRHFWAPRLPLERSVSPLTLGSARNWLWAMFGALCHDSQINTQIFGGWRNIIHKTLRTPNRNRQ